MIARYTLPEMASIWSEERKLETWLDVELAIVDALSKEGTVPEEAARRIRESARFDIARVKDLESVTKHDVLSFVECVCESLGEDSCYFHMGVTSSDVLDTSLAILMRDSINIVLDELRAVKDLIAELARKHECTLTIGRTHGMHAEPTSLGLKFAVWYNDFTRAVQRIERARDEVCVGKVSGAVGNYSHFPPGVEDTALGSLGLDPERPATQVVQRDRHAFLLATLALAAAVMEKVAVELRHLQRTEVAEMEEPFTPGQKGSSSMPHKRNPITLERITGLARLVRAHAAAGFENVALWHERDISHSSVERVIIPDSTTVVHYMARCLKQVLDGLEVNAAKMRQNIDLTHGLIYSQRLMICLMEAGWQRIRAYEKVQALAGLTASGGQDLKEVSMADEEVTGLIGADVLEGVFDPGFYIRHAHTILTDAGITPQGNNPGKARAERG
ncbi:MAG: adenylosuccinate lyase [Candidatus Eisenbacteria bacterium]